MEYNPLTNNDQMVEIMEKLIHLHNLSIHGGFAGTDTTIRNREGRSIADGKTIHEAVCNAAYEYFSVVR